MRADTGTYTFRINGQIHHYMGSLVPKEDEGPKFAQIYILDQELQTEIRTKMFPVVNKDKLSIIQNLLHKHNPYVRIFQQLGDKIKNEKVDDISIVLKSNYKKDKRYNLPTSNEIAVLMVNDNDPNKIHHRDIVIQAKDGPLQRINETHRSYDALQYTTIFVNGCSGWAPNLYEIIKKVNNKIENNKIEQSNSPSSQQPDKENETQSQTKYVTCKQFYAYRLQDRIG
jgi:hypothetical protein